MNTFAIPSTAPAAPRGGFRRLALAFHEWNMRRITDRDLARLNPHLLRDIGLTPPQPDPVAEILRKARTQW